MYFCDSLTCRDVVQNIMFRYDSLKFPWEPCPHHECFVHQLFKGFYPWKHYPWKHLLCSIAVQRSANIGEFFTCFFVQSTQH